MLSAILELKRLEGGESWIERRLFGRKGNLERGFLPFIAAGWWGQHQRISVVRAWWGVYGVRRLDEREKIL